MTFIEGFVRVMSDETLKTYVKQQRHMLAMAEKHARIYQKNLDALEREADRRGLHA